jgi:hypothetical protein
MPAKVRRFSTLLPLDIARVAGQQGRSFVALLLLAQGVAGCERKAPGPEACVKFAESWFGVDRERVLRDAALSKHFDAKISDCLTKPYDRELVECVMNGGDNRRCERSYERRLLVGKRGEAP